MIVYDCKVLCKIKAKEELLSFKKIKIHFIIIKTFMEYLTDCISNSRT